MVKELPQSHCSTKLHLAPQVHKQASKGSNADWHAMNSFEWNKRTVRYHLPLIGLSEAGLALLGNGSDNCVKRSTSMVVVHSQS